jgi:hypothetical protein
MLIWPADPTNASQWDHEHTDDLFRIAVLSTPRTGNTWLRRMLDAVYSMRQIVEGDLAKIEWSELPRQCIIQTHWPPEPDLLAQLKKHEVRVITLSRHPFDVLISILHFASVHTETDQWLAGREGNEKSILLATPRSREFIEYASGPRAKALLGISARWAAQPDCITVSYERLVENPARELAGLCRRLRPVPTSAIEYAVRTHELDKQRLAAANQHYWQGSPGHWKRLLPEAESRDLASACADTLAAFGYVCDPNPQLTPSQADAFWYGLELLSLKRECQIARSQILKLQQAAFDVQLANLRVQVDQLFDLRTPLTIRVWRRLRRMFNKHSR